MSLRQTLFWDVDPKTIDVKKHARYIIERIIDYGNDDEVRWLLRTYSSGLVGDVVKKSRVIQKYSKPLWLALTQRKQFGN